MLWIFFFGWEDSSQATFYVIPKKLLISEGKAYKQFSPPYLCDYFVSGPFTPLQILFTGSYYLKLEVVLDGFHPEVVGGRIYTTGKIIFALGGLGISIMMSCFFLWIICHLLLHYDNSQIRDSQFNDFHSTFRPFLSFEK